MQRGDEFADVHPDEVANWKLHDWAEVADEKPSEGKAAKAKKKAE